MTEIKGPDGQIGRMQEMPELTRAEAAGGEAASPAKASGAPAQLPADRFEKHQATLLDNLTGRAELAQAPAARQAEEAPRMIIRDHLQIGQQGLAQNIWGEKPGSPKEVAGDQTLPAASQQSLPEGSMIGLPAGKPGLAHSHEPILKPVTFQEAAGPHQEAAVPAWAGVGKSEVHVGAGEVHLLQEALPARMQFAQSAGMAQSALPTQMDSYDPAMSIGNLAAPPTGGAHLPEAALQVEAKVTDPAMSIGNLAAPPTGGAHLPEAGLQVEAKVTDPAMSIGNLAAPPTGGARKI